MIVSLGIIFVLLYLMNGRQWSAGAVMAGGLFGILSVSAVWLCLAIRWVDGRQGWAEQQARKGPPAGATAAGNGNTQ
jgi:hypothetical protein